MDLFKIRLYSAIILVILCIDFSAQQFEDNDYDYKNETKTLQEYSSGINATMAQSSASFSTTSTTFPSETRSTSEPTSPSTFSSIPSTTSPTSTSTSPSTTPSTKPPTTQSTTQTQTSVQSITTSTSLMPSTDEMPKTSSEKPKECLKLELNAKIFFKYKSKEGFDQQFEIIGGNTNGELIQPDKCRRNQTLIIKYDLVEKTKLILGISISETDFSINGIRFEYPIYRLPDDFNKENHSEEVQTCSADERQYDKCLIAENNNLFHYSLKYKINDQIYCKELPLIVLKNNQTSIDILFKDFRLIITDSQTNAVLIERSDEFCPINTINSDDNELDAMFAGSTKIWVGVGYAVFGAFIMFGFAFIYEKFVREKLLYNPIEREEPEV